MNEGGIEELTPEVVPIATRSLLLLLLTNDGEEKEEEKEEEETGAVALAETVSLLLEPGKDYFTLGSNVAEENDAVAPTVAGGGIIFASQ